MIDYSLRRKSYKEIRVIIQESTPVKEFRQGMLAGHICRLISPYFSCLFIKKGISPNQITLFMIGFGIIGSLLFAMPDIWCKILGYICWFLWFTMDLSDGEVARTTRTFSKYGTEMDYMAHLIDHPCMIFAIWITFLQMQVCNPIFLFVLFFVLLSMELVLRSLTAFNHYQSLLSPSKRSNSDEQSWPMYLLSQVVLFPTFIICFSWIIVLDYIVRGYFSFVFFIMWMSLYLLLFLRIILNTIKKFLS